MNATVVIDFVMDDWGDSGCFKVRHDVDFDFASAVDSVVEEMYSALLERSIEHHYKDRIS